MDEIFLEEQKNLEEIEHKIDMVAAWYEKKAKKLHSEIKDFRCLDYDDRDVLMDLKRSHRIASEAAEQYRGYQPSPYFGRLDLDQEDGDNYTTGIYYIGKEGIAGNGEVIVVDWRNPIGSVYYATNQKDFNIEGTNYSLALRRALEIKDAKLINYKTEYDGETVSLEGDVIDPFLLTVLKDKRRQNRLTDIIRTIQGNQNDIIRKPRTESFVVQGCAGSGKTMILLHRLSYLKFNNRGMSLAGVKIITPNKFFDAHINNLSVELGLTAIERCSVEEYYVSLIKRFSNKITVDADVHSEKTLNTDLLKEIYSTDYMNEALEHYNLYWGQALTEINENKLRGYFEKYNQKYPDTDAYSSDTYSRLSQGIQYIFNSIDEAEKRRKTTALRLEETKKEISTLLMESGQAFSNLEAAKKELLKRLENGIPAAGKVVENKEKDIDALYEKRNDLINQRRELEVESDSLAANVRLFSRTGKEYWNYDQFIQIKSAVANIIRNACKDEIAKVKELEQTFQKTPVYNFGKRNELKKQIAEAKDTFSRKSDAFIKSYIEKGKNRAEEIVDLMESIADQIVVLSEDLQKEEMKLQGFRNRHAAYIECQNLFDINEYPDTQKLLTKEQHEYCGVDLLDTFEKHHSAYTRFNNRLKDATKTHDTLEVRSRELEANAYPKETIEYITSCVKVVNRLQIGEIFKNVMLKDILACYRKYGQKYHKANYRHKIYLRLLYCSMYYSRLMNVDNFLNIDEAQDISLAEYKLLRKILGEKCIFNLYGDINQLVYTYKGISDWEDINDITGGNIYVLNENYRNTLQITEFCNKEFGAEVYPIGVSGEAVHEMDTAAAVQWILGLKKNNPEYRVAILHRHGLKAVQESLHTLLRDEDVSWYAVDDEKLSVVSVETAKGLEFEAIVSIVDQMSNNEKYISYTRALDCLAVVRDRFSDELEEDDTAEDLDDEFMVSDDDSAGEGTESSNNSDAVVTHATGKFFSWEILGESTAVKTCDKSFFEYNQSGVPKEIGWFFNSGLAEPGDSKDIVLVFDEKQYEGKVAYESTEQARMRISWNADLGELFAQYKNTADAKAVFEKIAAGRYVITLGSQSEDNSVLLPIEEQLDEGKETLEDDLKTGTAENRGSNFEEEDSSYSKEDFSLIAEFDSILEERFDEDHKLTKKLQEVVLDLYHGKSVAFNAPSGSMKNVLLYLLAHKEHQASGKQTILTAESYLQENELVLAERLGLKGGMISGTISEFLADFKKEKYDIVFVPYEFFEDEVNISEFTSYFADKVAFWGIDHPTAEVSICQKLFSCAENIGAIKFLMSKEGFAGIDVNGYSTYEITSTFDTGIVKKITLYSSEEKTKWMLDNLDKLSGQGIVYCNDEETCKLVAKTLRKKKILAEAFIDALNPDKKERINYLTNTFSKGGLAVLVTTHDIGKNLANPRIRFILHYDTPEDGELHALHVSQIGKLAEAPNVYDLVTL